MDEIRGRKHLRAFLLMLLTAFAITQIFAMARAPLPRDEYSDFIVRDLMVEDLPNDDGGGLRISWEPLDIDARVIEYRVYRGSTKDKLFYIGSVPINPRTGFAGDRVNFYDSSFNVMSTVNSPRRLRQEVQQEGESPIYQEIPRDLSVIEHKFEKYTVLGVIPKKNYYYRSRLVEIPGEDGEESQYFAGLRDRHLTQLLSKLKADKTYYYSVIAVNEQRRYYPYAPVVSGVPRINRPEQPRRFYPVLVDDIGRMQFEWSMPLTTDGVGRVGIYLLAKRDVNNFKTYLDQTEKAYLNRYERYEEPDAEEYQVTAVNPAKQIGLQPFSQMNLHFIDLKNRELRALDGTVALDINRNSIDDYFFVQSFINHWGMETFGEPVSMRKVSSDKLPSPPVFTVMDKPNERGENNLIYWDKPVVFLTNSTFLNEDRTRIRVNYEFETNKEYHVNNIYFDLYDERYTPGADNEEFRIGGRVNEFYQNLFFNVRLPEKYGINSAEYDIDRPIYVEMSFDVSGNELTEDYVISQKLLFDEDYLAYMPKDPYLRRRNISKYVYSIYKKPYSGESFGLSSRTAGIIRQADDMIRYVTSVNQIISKVDSERQMLLVSTAINAFYDKEERRPVNTHIFYSLVEQENEKNKNRLNELKTKMETADEEERAGLQAQIDQVKQALAVNDYDFMQEANSQPNDRRRMKMLMERREREMRTFQYKMVQSDGEGLFVQTDVYEDDDGNKYFIPVPNLFNFDRSATLVATFLWGFIVFWMIKRAKKGKDLYIRPIAGIEEIDNAIGRATEMGRPILFQPGLDGIGSVATLAGLNILGKVAKKAAEYDTRILVPVRDVITLPIAQEIIKEAHYEAGRPDTYEKNSAFFISTQQFAFVAGVNGVMMREKCATCFYMGMYYAEALIMTEVGNTIGAVQIAGTDAVTQVPFFITTCDYTLIGEELYGASAYLTREPMMMGTLKATDVAKFIILVCMITGAFLSTIQYTFFINMFPDQ